MMKIQPIVLSGGSGSRLWPLSRSNFPKQFHALCGTNTLLQQTALRLAGEPFLPPIVVCNQEQRFIVAEQLQSASLQPTRIILEPVARSTAPALALSALSVSDPAETILVAMPADHFIEDEEAFRKTILQAAQEAAKGVLMTLGIKPRFAHTGFGYIEFGEALDAATGACRVIKFTEKPELATAKAYVDDGRHLWNSGIFVFRADAYLAALEKHQPDMAKICGATFASAKQDLDFLRLPSEALAPCPALSVDYAIMEKTDRAGVLPVDFAWNDIGSWSSLWSLGQKDENQNVILGDAIIEDVKNSYVRSEKRLVAAIGLENIAIVETKDAVLVASQESRRHQVHRRSSEA
jgi:mannose-1-phosphate guanylyltransferase/mannose-6-phosphate isomerase